MKRVFFTFLLSLAVLGSVSAQNKSLVFCAAPDYETGDKDIQVINAINNQGGYDITILDFGVLDEAIDLPVLNAADVVIMGRSIPSPDVGSSREIWDKVTSPVLSMNMWGLRNLSDRAQWVATEGGTAENVVDDENALIQGAILVDDPIFDGKTGTIDWWNGRFSAFLPDTDFGNGQVLVQSTDGRALMVRWSANVEYWNGLGRSPMSERTYMGNGQDNTEPVVYFGFSESSSQIFFAELARMAAGATPVANIEETVSVLSVYHTSNTVSITMNKLNRIEIYSLDGKMMMSESSRNNTIVLTSDLQAGIYIVKAFDQNNSVATEKFVIR